MNHQLTGIKKDDILKTAHHLFWKHGIKRVTIEEVCREANVSKMTFYRFYRNKIELAKAVLADIFDSAVEQFLHLMAEDIPFEEKVKKQILMKFEGTKEISQELIKDIYSGQIEEIKDFWDEKREHVLRVVLESYKNAQKEGLIRQDVKIEFIEHYSNKLFELVSDPKAAAVFNNPQEMIMQLINLFFYGILPHNK